MKKDISFFRRKKLPRTCTECGQFFVVNVKRKSSFLHACDWCTFVGDGMNKKPLFLEYERGADENFASIIKAERGRMCVKIKGTNRRILLNPAEVSDGVGEWLVKKINEMAIDVTTAVKELNMYRSMLYPTIDRSLPNGVGCSRCRVGMVWKLNVGSGKNRIRYTIPKRYDDSTALKLASIILPFMRRNASEGTENLRTVINSWLELQRAPRFNRMELFRSL